MSSENITEENELEQQEPFPELLSRKQSLEYLVAGVIVVGAIICTLTFKLPKALLLALLGLVFVYKGLQLKVRWESGRIVQQVLICQSVRKSSVKDRINLTFFNGDEENPLYYSFLLPGKRNADDFIIGAVYIVYFDLDNPKELITYMAA